MVETRDWTTCDLVEYLVSIQSTLTSEEIELLRQSSAFLKESVEEKPREKQYSAEASQRVRVKDLYEPLAIYRELGLPVIDWGTDNQWSPKSDEGKFLS